MLRTVLLLLFASTLFACQGSTDQREVSPSLERTTNSGIKTVTDTTVEAATREYVSTMWCGDGISGAAFFRAKNIYRYENCGELQETLEIPEVREGLDRHGNTVSAAFLRYSIGTKVFREVLWFRKIGERYASTTDRPTSYSDEEDWNAEALEAAEEADNWEENSADWYK